MFMSSMSAHGLKLIKELSDDNFKVCIEKPPMVYGDNSPSNLTKLFKAVKKFHIFPTIKNKRSSIAVDKLVENIKEYIDNNTKELYLPQNDEYMYTYAIIKEKNKVI